MDLSQKMRILQFNLVRLVRVGRMYPLNVMM